MNDDQYDWEADALGCYNLCIEEMRKRMNETGEIPSAMLGYGPHSTRLLLEVRAKTHGDFRENSRIAQFLREFYRSCRGWRELSDAEREAFDMEAIKSARILSGGADRVDSWRDKAGYSQLAVDHLTR